MNTCLSCGGDDPRSDEAHESMPYCAACWYSGRASTHYTAEFLKPLRAAGFDACCWQTGGGCQNIVVPFTEAGYDGPFAYFGMVDGREPEYWELGVQLMGHMGQYTYPSGPRKGETVLEQEWCGEVRDCPACVELARLEEELQPRFHQIDDPVRDFDVAAEALVPIARQIAIAVLKQKENHR